MKNQKTSLENLNLKTLSIESTKQINGGNWQKWVGVALGVAAIFVPAVIEEFVD